MAAIHLILGIPSLDNEADISTYLKIPNDLAGDSLQILEQLGLVERVGTSKWKRKVGSIHLPKDSPVSQVNHILWRNKVIQALQSPNPLDFHYSAIHTISRSDLEKIKKILISAIDETRTIIDPSPEEELICFNVDLFKV